MGSQMKFGCQNFTKVFNQMAHTILLESLLIVNYSKFVIQMFL